MTRSRSEVLRRLRLGDLRKLIRHRYGPTLPDDDAGREDLAELLKPVSLDPWQPARKMANVIEVAAPWMDAEEGGQLIDWINRLPARELWPTARALGERLNLSAAERERLRTWTIHPADMTDAQMAEHRRAKARARMRCKRLEAGAKPREVYLANALSRLRPWESEGISRATWFRRQAARETSPCGVLESQKPVRQVRAQQRLLKAANGPVSSQQGEASKEACQAKVRRQTADKTQTTRR